MDALLHPTTPILLSILLLLPLAYLYTSHASRTLFPTLTNSSILLLTAHPDDESMFFAPTVQALTRPELGNHLKVLCLSTGDAEGLGEVRRGELRSACARLGVGGGGGGTGGGGGGGGDVLCLDDPRLQDGAPWSPTYISSLLLRTFAPAHPSHPSNKSSSSTTSSNGPTETTITALLTFDANGVSSHPNHISTHQGALAFHSTLMRGHEAWDPPCAIYTLSSVSLLRKYTGFVDIFVSVVLSMLRVLLRQDKDKRGFSSLTSTSRSRSGGGSGGSSGSRGGQGADGTKKPSWLLYVAGPGEWWNGVCAMVQGHKSQMVWFRWGWVGVGRYMVVNDLRRVR